MRDATHFILWLFVGALVVLVVTHAEGFSTAVTSVGGQLTNDAFLLSGGASGNATTAATPPKSWAGQIVGRIRARGMQSLGMSPDPMPTGFGPVEAPMGPVAMAPQGWGARFPTQVAGYCPDVQRRCGVESLASQWTVATSSDIPYWQQSVTPAIPRRLQTDGRAPGQQLGPASVSTLLGPQRQARAAQLKAIAAGTLGW